MFVFKLITIFIPLILVFSIFYLHFIEGEPWNAAFNGAFLIMFRAIFMSISFAVLIAAYYFIWTH